MAALRGGLALRRPFFLLASALALGMMLVVQSAGPAHAQTGFKCVLVEEPNEPTSFANLTIAGELANNPTDLACGPNAVANGGGATAVGNEEIAQLTNGTSVGFQSGLRTNGVRQHLHRRLGRLARHPGGQR